MSSISIPELVVELKGLGAFIAQCARHSRHPTT